eukprot:TRINITY_DN102957_c0_g1_i1.p1 TRINITY_DN102957_c0_g1~~TRINITY_DN102957_c0_g1_i1.p1  ORF type:complete len:505 (-),score=26.94 TRINITY_DN102957_c0_g1_i1:288-1664(-)
MALSAPCLHIVTPSSILVSWSAVLGADVYDVVVCDGSLPKWVDFQTGSLVAIGQQNHGASTWVVVEGVKPGVPYKAAVCCRRGTDWSQFSDFSGVLVLPKPQTPQRPTLQVAGPSKLLVSWPAVPSAEMYAVSVYDGAKKCLDLATGSDETWIIATGLDAGTEYRARVACKHSNTWSENSESSLAVKLSKPTPPQPPTVQIISSSQLLVSWSAVPGMKKYGVILENGQTTFKFDAKSGTLRERADAARDAAACTQTWVVVGGVEPNATYKAKVCGKQGSSWSSYSAYGDPVKLTIAPKAPILEPVNDTMMVASWEEVPGASMYDVAVFDGKTQHVDWNTNLLQPDRGGINGGSGTSVLIKGLKKDWNYRAKVAAKLGSTWSQYSDFGGALKLCKREAEQSTPEKRSLEQSCVICLNRSPDVAFDPCGHLCVCSNCADGLTSCPMCRDQVSKKLRIYSC